jgi:uncharacterized protein (DUF433 family)
MAKTVDIRFDVPLYTVAEAARILGVHASTFLTWSRGYERHPKGRPSVKGAPIVTTLPDDGSASIPFVGLAEGLVLAAVRRAGVPMQRIRPALEVLRKRLDLDHALASQRLYTDGAELLYSYGRTKKTADEEAALELVVVRSGQHVFVETIRDYLQRLEYASDGYARMLHVPGYMKADVVCDPERSFGRPIFSRGGSRLDDVLERFWTGETLQELALEFGVPLDDLEDALRVASRRAA